MYKPHSSIYIPNFAIISAIILSVVCLGLSETHHGVIHHFTPVMSYCANLRQGFVFVPHSVTPSLEQILNICQKASVVRQQPMLQRRFAVFTIKT